MARLPVFLRWLALAALADWLVTRTLARELEWVRQNPKARQAKSKARLNRFEELSNTEYQKRNETNEIFIPVAERLGNEVIEFKGVSKSYGDRLLIDDLSFKLPPGGIDTVLLVDTIHYVKDIAGYAKAIRPGLAPGGRVAVPTGIRIAIPDGFEAQVRPRSGLAIDYLRVRAFPFGAEVEEFLAAHQTVFVVEQNRDAQLRMLLTVETAVDKQKLRSILHYDGLPLSADFIIEGDAR